MDDVAKLLFVVLLALIPSLFWFRVFLKEDYREPEPKKLLIVFFILGIVAGLASLGVETLISYMLFGNMAFEHGEHKLDELWIRSNIFKILLFNIFVPPIVEEFFKCGAAKKAGMHSMHFNQIIDGMIYAIAVGLGFAFMENYIYFMRFLQEGADVLAGGFILRFLASTLLHALATGTFGYYMAKAKFSDSQSNSNSFLNSKQKYIITGFILAVAIHFMFNFLIMFGFAQYSMLASIFIGLTFFEKMRSSEAQSFWYSNKKDDKTAKS